MTNNGEYPNTPWIMQFCHSHSAPFMDCARQYAALFYGTRYKVCTVYLTGAPSEEVVRGSASDEVIFLDYSKRQVRALKLRQVLAFRRLLRTRHFVLCIAQRVKPAYIALLSSNLPVVGVHHGFGDYQRWSRRFFVRRFKQRLSLLGVSNATCDNIMGYMPDWPRQRIATLYNRVNVAVLQAEQLPREQARAQLGLPQDAFVVGNAGRLHPVKDQALLIRGFARARASLPAGAILVIMGSGRLEAELKDMAARELPEDAVYFLGQVDFGRRYFQAFDQFVLTSKEENCPMVLLEAMAAGVPIICRNDCGGGPEVAAEEVLFAADPGSLAQAMAETAQRKHFPWHSSALERFTDDQARVRFKQLLQQFDLDLDLD